MESYFDSEYFDLLGRKHRKSTPLSTEESGQVNNPSHVPVTLRMRPKPIRGRILWPALGFPAVIAPRDKPPEIGSDAAHSICVLLLCDKRDLSKQEAASHLRYVPWERRHHRAGKAGSFEEVELDWFSFHETSLAVPGRSDSYAATFAFGGNREGGNGITVNLAHYVRAFYSRVGLKYLYQIRVKESASARLENGLYHLFWDNQDRKDTDPSEEMELLLGSFARPARITPREEYEFEYGSLRRPYLLPSSKQRRRTEILHPFFVRRDLASSDLKLGHITDTHVNVRADVYDENLKRQNINASYSNWNQNFLGVYTRAKHESNIILLTGDLVDYGRGHWGSAASHRLGDDSTYHLDRNWFLFHYLLASGQSYTVPVYTILGNHDWRLNPYPPFAVAGAPKPGELFSDSGKLYTKSRATETQADILERRKREKNHEENLRKAHGPGDKRKFSVYSTAESKWQLIWEQPFGALKALVRLFFQTQTLDEPHTPIQTSIESVAWYLLAINPFLDYSFHLPGGHSVLMLDWAVKEDVLFPVAIGGKEWPYFLWALDDASAAGPKARNCLTALQKRLAQEFIDPKVNPGKAKIIGIHAPPIGPYPHWSDVDLAQGRKTYEDGKQAQGLTTFATRKPDGKIERWNGHPLFAITPKGGAAGMTADFGSFNEERDWLIRECSKQTSGVRLVLSGHIHRNGLYVVHKADAGVGPLLAGELLVHSVQEKDVRHVNPPAIALTPEGQNGPLYVTTTSAGPRGHSYPLPYDHYNIDPGYAQILFSIDGTIQQVSFRKVSDGHAINQIQFSQAKTAEREAAHGG